MKEDRLFWMTVRKALLMMVKAIEVRYGIGKEEGVTG